MKPEQTNFPKDSIPPHRKKIIFLSALLIIILGFAAYGNSINSQFILDDEHLIENNTYIKNWSHMPQLFSEDIGAGVGLGYHAYRPLQMVTYMIDYSLWKLNPFGYHLTNIVLHILVALGIYFLINALFNDHFLSLLTGSFYVVHPIHTEVVTYISGRADSLALLFMLLSFFFYLKCSPSKGIGTYLLLLLSYSLALLSRENSLILPVLMLLYHYSFEKKLKVKAFFSIVGLAGLYILLRITILGALLIGRLDTSTLIQRLPGFFIAITSYIRLLFFPFNLHMEYGNFLFSWGDLKAILGVVILFAVLIYAFRRKRDDQLVFFSITWFVVALFPVSNLFPINAYMAEHWLYVPSIGFFLIAAKAISSLCRTKNFKTPATIIAISLLIFYSYLTIRQNVYWKEPLHFYERTLKYAPHSARMYSGLGIIYNAMGKREEAVTLYKKAIEIKSDYAKAHYNLGIAYAAMNKKEEAVAAYKKAIGINADYIEAYNNLGTVYVALNKNEEAVAIYKKAIEINADYGEVYNNLGIAYAGMNKKEEAATLFKQAIEIDPSYANSYSNLALIYFQKKQYKLAIEFFDKARSLGFTKPELLEALKPYR